jgi:hypothetical protein
LSAEQIGADSVRSFRLELRLVEARRMASRSYCSFSGLVRNSIAPDFIARAALAVGHTAETGAFWFAQTTGEPDSPTVTPIQKARWLGDASDTQMVTS